MSLLQLHDVTVHYTKAGSFFRQKTGEPVLDRFSLQIHEGEIYGLVGESGSGKSTAARAIIGLQRLSSGRILFRGSDLADTTRQARRQQMNSIQMIFQDPYSSLNPRKNVWKLIAEPLRNFHRLTKEEEWKHISTLLQQVGLQEDSIYQYPHQFSGGQRQRIGIARALALNPQLLIADEPVSALDVSVQAQVLNFIREIQEESRLTMLFISHDLGVVRHLCDRIGILYKGRLVEEGTASDLFERPHHIYTKRLLAAMPEMNPDKLQEKLALRREMNEEYNRTVVHAPSDGIHRISDTHWYRP